MTRPLPGFRGVTLLILLASLPGLALAQDDEATIRARQLFGEGTRLMQERDFAGAEARFRQAMALHDAPTIRYNLASALLEQDRLTEADELCEQVLADPESTDELRGHAERLRAQIDARAGSLTVELAYEGADGVALDGRRLPDGRVGRPMPVTPGSHRVEAMRGTESLVSEEVQVRRRHSATVRLEPAAPTPGEAAAASTAPDSAPAEADHEGDGAPLVRDWRLWAGVGSGVLLVVIVIAAIASGGGGGSQEPPMGDFDPAVLTWR